MTYAFRRFGVKETRSSENILRNSAKTSIAALDQ